MKHLLHKLNSLRLLTLLTLLLGVGGSQVWADTSTLTFKAACGGSGTADDGVTWTVASDGAESTFDSTKGIHYGTSSAAVKYIKLSTTKDISGTITKVVANASTASGVSATVSVTVGGSAFGGDAQSLSTSATDYTFTGSAKGEIVVTVTKPSKTKGALYVKSIIVTYENKTSTTLALSSTNLSDGKLALTVPNGTTETLTATVTPAGGAALENPTITWTSSDETVATVAAGVVTPLKEGKTTITASYAGNATYEESSNTCEVTVNDARTAVNLTGFSATTTTLVKGSTTLTTATNDQSDCTATYTYSSSDENVATVASNGVITAVAKGTATITCELSVNSSDPNYKAGTPSSMTVDITVTNPFHKVTFSSNGRTYGEPASVEVEEGESITLPAVDPSVDGKSFCGWVTTPIAGTTNTKPDFVTSPVKVTSNVTYYAVFADEVAGGEVTTTKTITPSTTNIPTSYGTANTFTEYTLEGVNFKVQQMYKTGEKLQWRAAGNSNGTGTMYNTDALGKLQSIVLTYASGDSNKNFTVYVGDEVNPTSGTSVSPKNEGSGYTYDCSTYNKTYFVLTNGEGAGYLTSIAITYKAVGPTTYKNYCTTVSDLPLAVVTLSTDAIEMTWGESGKTLTATATVDDETIAEPITFTPSSPDLTIDGSGNISCNVPGNYTITASVAETDEHQAGQAICSVTVNKKDIELTFENAEVITIDEELGYTQTATATPETGAITYAITSSSSENAEIDENTGELTFINTGVIEVTATAPATTLYNGNTATYTLYVKTTPTITVSNQSVAYGSTFTVDNSAITGGDITVTSGSTTIATVDGLTITPVAVGSTTITVATAESDTYVAGEETFTLTVTAPEASSTNTAKETIFYESFDENTGTAGWSGSAGNGIANFDNDGWTKEYSVYGGDKCIKLAAGTKAGAVTTPSITTTSGTTYTLTFKAGSWSGDGSTLTLSGNGTRMLSTNSIKLEDGTFNEYTVTFTANFSSVTIKFSAASGKRLFLDEIKITKPLTSTSVTTTGGLATYCYQYPLDLDGISGAKAYVVKDVDMEKGKVMLTQITGTIKGGVPFILKADGDDATFEIPLADGSTTVPAGNLLVGTLAPTFVAQTSDDNTNFAYSKSNKCFVKLGEAGNTVPANRAYLPVNLGGAGVKSFALTFDNADGIARTQIEGGEERVYNLAGQRLQKAQRGVNIINGRKVLVK